MYSWSNYLSVAGNTYSNRLMHEEKSPLIEQVPKRKKITLNMIKKGIIPSVHSTDVC